MVMPLLAMDACRYDICPFWVGGRGTYVTLFFLSLQQGRTLSNSRKYFQDFRQTYISVRTLFCKHTIVLYLGTSVIPFDELSKQH